MICTRCGSHNCLRSHRHKADFLLSALGILPWRCLDCRARFHAGRVPLRNLFYAHCSRCGNLQLDPIRPDRLDSGLLGRVAVLLGARSLRCDFCRHNFVSWLPLGPSEEWVGESDEEEQSAAGARK